MDKFIIRGGKPLIGEVNISGAKNAVLPIMAACISFPGKYTLRNVPRLRDTFTMKRLLEIVGSKVDFNDNVMVIDTSDCNTPIAPYDLVKTMRASFYVLGPFLSRFGKAEVSLPGGCAWGPRPVDYHLEAMKTLGAKVKLDDGMMIVEGKLNGGVVNFKQKSVGATGNVIMAAVTATGKTLINNAAQEPEIVSLCEFLIKMGANINGIGTDKLTIYGNSSLNSNIDYTIIPDRIEAGTFLIAGAITRGNIKVNKINSEHLDIVIRYLGRAGFDLDVGDDYIEISSPNKLINPVSMTTETYPGFPTDLQAQWMSLMTIANGKSKIIEGIYIDRYTHISELSRFGANIKLNKNIALISGNDTLKGAPVMSTDIRASASLILAALSANGQSSISRIYHIDRGYERIECKLLKLNAKIIREHE